MDKILIKNIRAVDASNDFITDVFISDGIISEVSQAVKSSADVMIDGMGLVLMPSLFDMHVHFRDPGFTYKEDVISGCSAALAGGVTGVVCMPNTNPPIDNPETVKYIKDKAKDTGVDVFPACCITKGMKGDELCDYDSLMDAGVIAASDDGRPVKNAAMMRNALDLSVKNNIRIISHCEDLDIINGGIMNNGSVSEKLGVKGMDRSSEEYITAREIILAASVGAAIHIAHVSTAESVEIIRLAKMHGLKVTCETCPHYFMLTDEKLLERDADFRMNPPLRTSADVKAVADGIADGTIDCIVTDHAPHTSEEKSDFYKAPNGVVGLETSLAATLTALYHTNKLKLNDIVRLMSAKPREILGLPVISIKNGMPADLVIVDTQREWKVIPDKLHSKSHNTVFKGMTLKGKPLVTISKGKIKYNEM